MFGSLGVFAGLGLDSGGAEGVPSTIREAIYYLLLDDPEIYAAVDDRIWPGGLPQDPDYPALTINLAGRNDVRNLRGRGDTSEVRLRVSAWSRLQIEAVNLARLIQARLVDFKGDVGDVRITGCALVNEIDLPERPTTGTDQFLYQVVSEFQVWHRP